MLKGERRSDLDTIRQTSSVHAVHCKPPDRQEERVDKQNAVEELERNAKLNWPYKLKLLNEYVAYHDKFVEMLLQFENRWDCHLGLLTTVQH